MEPVYCTFYLEEVPLSQLLESEREVTQLCPTLCDPMDCSLPGSFIHGISRQEYWSGLPFPSLGDLPNPGIKLRSPTLQPDTLHLSHQGRMLSQKLHIILFPEGVVSILTFVKNLPELFLPAKWELGFSPSSSHPSLLRAASQLNSSSALLISGQSSSVLRAVPL